jgi:hypothetical protein
MFLGGGTLASHPIGATPVAASTSHSLTANNIVTQSPVLASTAVGQVHTLTATALVSNNPVFGTPSSSATVTQSLSANNITSGQFSFDSPVLSHLYVFAASDITSSSIVVSNATITQTHVLTSQNLVSGATQVSAVPLSMLQQLSTVGVFAQPPTLGTPVLVYRSDFTANDIIAGSPFFASTAISQAHALSPTPDPESILAGSPSIPSVSISQVQILSTADVVLGNPVFASPFIGQSHNAVANELLSGTPFLENSNAQITNNLIASDLVFRDPRFGSPVIAVNSALSCSDLVTQQVVFGTSVVEQVQNIGTNNIVVTPVVPAVALSQHHGLTTGDVTFGPLLYQPFLWKVNIVFSAGDVIHGNPVVGSAALSQAQILSPTSLFSTPVIPSVAIGQIHTFDTANLNTGNFSLPAVLVGQVHPLSANALLAQQPTFGSPSQFTRFDLEAKDLVTVSPFIGDRFPAFNVPQTFAFNNLVSSSFVFGSPNCFSHNSLIPTSINLSIAIPSVELNGVRSLSVTPILGTPLLGVNAGFWTYGLISQGITPPNYGTLSTTAANSSISSIWRDFNKYGT